MYAYLQEHKVTPDLARETQQEEAMIMSEEEKSGAKECKDTATYREVVES